MIELAPSNGENLGKSIFRILFDFKMKKGFGVIENYVLVFV